MLFFLKREIFPYNNCCLIIYLSYYLLIKHGSLNVSPFYVDMNCYYLNAFNVFIFLYIFLYLILIMMIISMIIYYFCYYCFCHCHCHYYFFIFNAFNFYVSSLYHFILSLYISNIFKF